jgi:membrane-bound lytic murein transglycosylase D
MDEKNRRLVPLFAALGALVAIPSAAEETFHGALVHVAAHSPTAIPGIESLSPLPTVLEIKDGPAPISTIDLTAQPDDLWERIRNGFAMPDLDSALVAKQQAYYLNHPQYLARLTERSRRYLHHIVEEIEKRGWQCP